MTIKFDPNVIRDMINAGKRTGNRAFDEYRNIEIETGVAPLAEGSCRVKIGDTEVIAGVKLEIGVPYPDSPDEGSISVNSEFIIFASSRFEPGPPGEENIELSRVVDRAIRESKALDFKKMCITKAEKAWIVNIDLDIMNADGNMIDAACLASMAALMMAHFPEIDKETGRPGYKEKGKKPLPLEKIAVNTTFVKINDKILADPTEREEEAMDSRLTIGTFEDADNKENGLCSMQKGGSGGFTYEEVCEIIDMAEKKGKEIRQLLKKAVKD